MRFKILAVTCRPLVVAPPVTGAAPQPPARAMFRAISEEAPFGAECAVPDCRCYQNNCPCKRSEERFLLTPAGGEGLRFPGTVAVRDGGFQSVVTNLPVDALQHVVEGTVVHGMRVIEVKPTAYAADEKYRERIDYILRFCEYSPENQAEYRASGRWPRITICMCHPGVVLTPRRAPHRPAPGRAAAAGPRAGGRASFLALMEAADKDLLAEVCDTLAEEFEQPLDEAPSLLYRLSKQVLSWQGAVGVCYFRSDFLRPPHLCVCPQARFTRC